MPHQLPPLPYAMDALEPHISRETLEYHYGKHHQTYVKTLNELIQHTEFSESALEDIIRRADGPVFNNAARFCRSGAQALPVKIMVPYLRGVIENRAIGALDDVFERALAELGILNQLVQGFDVGLMMFAVMILKGFARRHHQARRRTGF